MPKENTFVALLPVFGIVFGLSATTTEAATLTFEGFSEDDLIPGSYGDITNLNVAYTTKSGFGNPNSIAGVRYASGGYGGTLSDVAYGDVIGETEIAQISFTPVNDGINAVITSFDLGFNSGGIASEWRIYNATHNFLLASSGPLTGTPDTQSFSPNISEPETIHLQWSNAANVAIDNVVYNVTTAPVPIPSAIWLLGSGVMCLVGVRGRFSNRNLSAAIE